MKENSTLPIIQRPIFRTKNEGLAWAHLRQELLSTPRTRWSQQALDPGSSTHAPWEELPYPLLGHCLLAGGTADRSVAMATCTTFAKAMLSSSKPGLAVKVVDFKPSLAKALRLVASWDVQLYVGLRGSYDATPSSLRPLLSLLAQEGVALPRVKKVACHDVLLDAGLAAIFPNELQLVRCGLAGGMLPLAGCSRLQSLGLIGRSRGVPPTAHSPADWLAQLQQVASLPSLTSLFFSPHEYPATFLPLCARHLTELTLNNCRPYGNQSSVQHEEQWQTAISSAAQCTNLLKLDIGPCTVQEVATLLSSLPHLQDLELQHDGEQRAGSTDGLASTLLQHTQLTRLVCHSLEGLQQCHADSPCSWKQLRLQQATPLLLSRLPLHSLTRPLQLRDLNLCDASGKRATVFDVQAAVSNLARSSTAPQMVRWEYEGDFMSFDFGSEPQGRLDSPVALLHAAAPMLPNATSALIIEHCTVDAQLVTALQQVLGSGISYLDCSHCTMHPSCWVQLARSLPHITELSITAPASMCSAAEVMAYLWAAHHCSTAAQDGPNATEEEHNVSLVFVDEDFDMNDPAWVMLSQALRSVREQLELLRVLGVKASVEVEWV